MREGVGDVDVAGRFNDILSVAAWVSRIASGAEKIIHGCLSGYSR
jgi:hypothetical protein